ncbi:MAG: ATP-binding protein [Sphaerochaetaceae bacterium]|jgi:hypothetical protein
MHVFLCDFLLDIVQNSLEADSGTVSILIEEDRRMIRFTVADDGKGMSEETQAKAQDPFYTDGIKHAKRKVGLGIPFLKQTVDETGGEFSLTSAEGKGTTVRFGFDMMHVDTPPFGDLPSTLVAVFSYPASCEIVAKRSLSTSLGSGKWEVRRSLLLDALGDLRSSGSLVLLEQYLRSQEDDLDAIRISHDPEIR